jgi:broad specificity phosphatase PhoE
MWFRRSKQRTSPSVTKAGRIHLVRHGEVENPKHVVYAGIEGFHLNAVGRRQAAEAADHLGELNVTGVLSSPLERAQETAAAVAALHGLEVIAEERLTEWSLSNRWQGVAWEDLPSRFPGELEAYLSDPTALPFAPEQLSDAAGRCIAAITEFRDASPDGDLVIVGHQDPIQATRLAMTGRSFDGFHAAKPGHGSVTTLVSSIGSDSSNDPDWLEATYWEPEQHTAFPPS